MHWQTKHPVEFSKNTHHTKHNTHKKREPRSGQLPHSTDFASAGQLGSDVDLDTKVDAEDPHRTSGLPQAVRPDRFRDPDLSGSPQASEKVRRRSADVKSAARDAGHPAICPSCPLPL